MARIHPESFDLIVIGTGLEEALIAAGAARCGKTVLHLDQAGHYGSAWSSLTLEEFLIWSRQRSDDAAVDEGSRSPRKQDSAADKSEQADVTNMLHIDVGPGRGSAYSNLQLYQQSIDLGSSRSFSLDLAGKVVYCASEAIDTMLAVGVQSYLEFKLFQESYLFTGSKLTSVPGSRAAVFKDRSLSPMDKRLLTRFLMQLGSSLQGNPFPQAAQSESLVALLNAQGLSPLMRQYIMYAVAMADSDQESLLAHHTSPTALSAAAKHQPTAPQPLPQSGTNALPGINKALPAPSSPHSPSQSVPRAPSAQHPQARSDAVDQDAAISSNSPQLQSHAPITVDTSSSTNSDPQAPSDASNQASNNSPSCTALSASHQSKSGPPDSAGIVVDSLMSVEEGLKALRQYLSSVGRYGPNSGAFLTTMYGSAELPQAFCRAAAVNGAVYVLRQPIHSILLDPETRQCRGIQTGSGQVVRCSALAASASILQQLINVPEAAGKQHTAQDDMHQRSAKSVSRAVCVLDGPIQEGEPQLLITIPPNTASIQNAHAIRIVQVGSAAAVCPANRQLLYMSTPSTATASEDLSRALSTLADTTKVLGSMATSTNSAPESAGTPDTDSGTDKQPEALLVAFFNQQCQLECDSSHILPSNVACCLPPDASLDVDSAFIHAKNAFRRLYPEDTAAFQPTAACNDNQDSDDEALDALGDVLTNLSAA